MISRATVLLLGPALLLIGCNRQQDDAPVADRAPASEVPSAEQPAPPAEPAIVDAASGEVASADAVADPVPGPKVGEPAPDFALSDQHGQQQRLANLLEQNSVALVFYRSADW